MVLDYGVVVDIETRSVALFGWDNEWAWQPECILHRSYLEETLSSCAGYYLYPSLAMIYFDLTWFLRSTRAAIPSTSNLSGRKGLIGFGTLARGELTALLERTLWSSSSRQLQRVQGLMEDLPIRITNGTPRKKRWGFRQKFIDYVTRIGKSQCGRLSLSNSPLLCSFRLRCWLFRKLREPKLVIIVTNWTILAMQQKIVDWVV